MSKSAVPTKRQRRPAERPDEIAAAALSLFCRRGYNVTSIDEIAAAAGVTKGAVYHHFDSKEDLLRTAVASFFDQAILRAMENVANTSDRDVIARVRAILVAGFELWITREFTAVFCLVFGEVGELMPLLRKEFLDRGPLRGWNTLAATIRDGQLQGTFRADVDASVVARTTASGLVLQCMLLKSAGMNKRQLRAVFEQNLETQLKLISTHGVTPHARASGSVD